MHDTNTKSIIQKHLLFGIAFGMAFPVVSTLIEAYIRFDAIGPSAWLAAQKTSYLLWVIDTAPFILGLVFFLIGVQKAEIVAANLGLEDKIKERTQAIDSQNKDLLKQQSEINRLLVESKRQNDDLKEREGQINALLEQTKSDNSALISQEEELRQNLEELLAVQEQLSVKNTQLERLSQEESKHKKRLEEEIDKAKQAHSDLAATNAQMSEMYENSLAQEAETREALEANQLMQAQLEDAKAKSEAANKAKTLFVEAISHEIRTPINVSLVYAQLLKNDAAPLGLPENFTDQLEIIRLCCSNLSELLNSISDLSKIESGSLMLKLEKLKVANWGSDLNKVLQGVASSAGISMSMDIDPGLPQTVVTDKGKITLVITNILAQLCKTLVTGTKLNLRLSKKRTNLALNISFDSMQDYQHVAFLAMAFRRYAKEGSSDGVEEINLVLSAKIMEMLNTSISLDEDNLTASILFPLSEFTDDFGDDITKPANWLDEYLGRYSTTNKVLIAEDNPMVRLMLKALFAKIGIIPAFAEDGLQAVEMAAQIKPTLILMDIRMPRMDGLEAAKIIISKNEFPTKILILTAETILEHRQTAKEIGVDGFMNKPVSIEDLLAVVDKHLIKNENIESESPQQADQNIKDSEAMALFMSDLRPLLEIPIFESDQIVLLLDQIVAKHSEHLPQGQIKPIVEAIEASVFSMDENTLKSLITP